MGQGPSETPGDSSIPFIDLVIVTQVFNLFVEFCIYVLIIFLVYTQYFTMENNCKQQSQMYPFQLYSMSRLFYPSSVFSKSKIHR